MIGEIRISLDAEDEGSLALARDVAVEALREEGWLVVSEASALTKETFTIVGVDTSTSQPFETTVEAASAQEAIDLLFAGNPDSVPAFVQWEGGGTALEESSSSPEDPWTVPSSVPPRDAPSK